MLFRSLLAAGISEEQASQVIAEHGMEHGMKKLQKYMAETGAGTYGGGPIGGKCKKGGRLTAGKSTSKAQMSKFLSEY